MPKVIPCNYGELKRVSMSSKLRHRTLTPGSFAIPAYEDEEEFRINSWTFCREYFHEDSENVKAFLFVCNKNKSRNVARFIDQIETKLKLRRRSMIGPTQRSNIIWVKPSPWWTKTSMKRSLFTAFLRAGNSSSIKENNFEEALFSIKYTNDTRFAVKRFLAGHTKYTGNVRGWFNQFRYGTGDPTKPKRPTHKEIKKLLVKPN